MLKVGKITKITASIHLITKHDSYTVKLCGKYVDSTNALPHRHFSYISSVDSQLLKLPSNSARTPRQSRATCRWFSSQNDNRVGLSIEDWRTDASKFGMQGQPLFRRNAHTVIPFRFVHDRTYRVVAPTRNLLMLKDDSSDMEDQLFDFLVEDNEMVPIAKFKKAIMSTGLRESDPRLAECMRNLARYQDTRFDESSSLGPMIGRDMFKQCIAPNIVLIASAFRNQFIIPDFRKFTSTIDQMYWNARDNIQGKVATYIPQLARYSPNLWGIAMCTVDGQRYSVGDVNYPFCLQSVSKPLTYAMALNDLSPEIVHEFVGQEPSGVTFNSLSLDYRNKPHNPMINAGAIAVCSLLKQGMNLADRFDYVTSIFKRLTGGEYLAFNNSVYLSEKETADRNFAIGYYMREKKCFPEGTNLMEVLDFYFQLCSLEVTCESGSVIAAALANGGVCPITGDKIFSASSVRDTLSLMLSCGLYDYSGEFAFKVGLPAKSGVSGVILIVVPNKMGFCVWSPALDVWGNSVRGVQFAKDLVAKFNFHHYDNLRFTPKKIDPCVKHIESRATDIVALLFSAFNNDVSALKRYALSDLNMEQADYDGRTALHIGAAEGHEAVIKFLINKCKVNPKVTDRWGFTPHDDAVRFGHKRVAHILKEAMDNYDPDEKIDRRFQVIDSVTYSEIAFQTNRDADNVSVSKTTDDRVVYNIDNPYPELVDANDAGSSPKKL